MAPGSAAPGSAAPKETEGDEDDEEEEKGGKKEVNAFMAQFEGPSEKEVEEMAYTLLEQENRAGIGLQFLLSNSMIQALTLNTDVVEALYKAIVEISTRAAIPLLDEPEAPAEDAEEDAKKAYEEAKAKVDAKNEETSKINSELEDLKQKIKIQGRMGNAIYSGSNEAAVVMINPVMDLNLTENITANLEASKINDDDEGAGEEDDKDKSESPVEGAGDATQSLTRPQGLKTMLVETRRGNLQIIPFHKGRLRKG